MGKMELKDELILVQRISKLHADRESSKVCENEYFENKNVPISQNVCTSISLPHNFISPMNF